MRKMNLKSWGLLCLLFAGFTLASCQQEEMAAPSENGMGAVKLNLNANVGFGVETKAVDEQNYMTTRPLSNYSVKILKDGVLVPGCEWKYNAIPNQLIELRNGTYEVVAFDGEEFNTAASTRDGIYMYGSTPFTVNGDQVAPVTVSCAPGCGKLQVTFSPEMDKYFSDYSVQLKTEATSKSGILLWNKADKDPLYLKLNPNGETITASFKFTPKSGTKLPVVKDITCPMKWGKFWNITVDPSVQELPTGMSITITFDDTVNEVPHNITIPSDWL